MPNIKSSAKRDQLSKVQNTRNKAYKSALKTSVKKFDAAVSEGDRDTAASTFKATVKSVDRAVSKGLIHKNRAARNKSRMAIALNQLSK